MGKILLSGVALVLMFPATRAAAETCRAMKTFQTPIAFDLQLPPPMIDDTRSSAALKAEFQNSDTEWLKKNGLDSILSASGDGRNGGLLAGWAVYQGTQTTGKLRDLYGFEQCYWFKNIDYRMMYRTIIAIPSHQAKNECYRAMMTTRGKRYHARNVAIVEKAIARLKKDLPAIVIMLENEQPFTDHRFAKKTVENMSEKLKQATDVYLTDTIRFEMNKVRDAYSTPEQDAADVAALRACRAARD